MRAYITTKLLRTLTSGERPYEVMDDGGRESIAGFRVRVEPSGTMTYYLRYRLDGKVQTQRLGRVGDMPLPQARDLARSLKSQAREHALGRAESPKPNRNKPERVPTIGEWVDGTYSPRVLTHKRSGTSTHKRLQAAFAGKIWEMPMDSPKLLQTILEWRQDRLDAGRKPSTVNRDCAVLRSAISHAVEMEVLDAHPLRRLRPLKETQESRVRFLSDNEEAALFAALDARDERIRAERDSANAWRRERRYAELIDLRTTPYVDFVKPVIILLLNTGMRRGECFSLRWDDIDLQNRFLTVRASGTKSGKARRIPLNDTCMEMLNAWGSMTTRDGIVFPSPRGGGNIWDFKKTWAGLMESAGIPDFRVHDLRHTFASRLVQRGVPLNTVRELLGHSSLTMTMRYAHLAPEHGLEAVLRLDAPKGSIVPFPAGKPRN